MSSDKKRSKNTTILKIKPLSKKEWGFLSALVIGLSFFCSAPVLSQSKIDCNINKKMIDSFLIMGAGFVCIGIIGLLLLPEIKHVFESSNNQKLDVNRIEMYDKNSMLINLISAGQ